MLLRECDEACNLTACELRGGPQMVEIGAKMKKAQS